MSAAPLSLRGLRGDVGWAAAAKIGTGLFQFGISLVMARMLGVSDFGVFEFAMRTLAVLLVLSNLGLAWKSLMLTSAQDREAPDRIGRDLSAALNTAFLFSVLVSAGFVALLLATGGEGFRPTPLELALLLLMVPAFTLLLIVSEAFRGLGLIREASIFSGVFSNGIAIIVLLGLYLVVGRISVVTGLVVIALAAAVACAFAYTKLREALDELRLNFDWRRMRAVAWESAPFAVFNILVAIAATLDIWAVMLLLTIEDVGIYGLAARLSQFFLVPWMIASAVFRGRIAQAIGAGDRAQLDHLAGINIKAVGLACLAALAGLALLAELFLRVFLPPDFAASERTMLVLALAFSIQATFGVQGVALLFSTRQLFKFAVPVAQIALFLALVKPLADAFGLEGMALAMLASIGAATALQALLYTLAFPRHRESRT